jgi:hypothetical protein
MNDNYQQEPLTPEDLRLLVELGKPMFAESRMIESYTSENPVHNGRPNDGSLKIQMGLEEMERQVRQASFVPPPPPPPYYPPVPVTPTYYQEPVMATPVAVPDHGQLEFNFNIEEQKKTNVLLETISGKLTKMIKLLEKIHADGT